MFSFVKSIVITLLVLFSANNVSAWYPYGPWQHPDQALNMCSDMGRGTKYRAIFKDVWRKGDISQSEFIPQTYCPLGGGTFIDSASGGRYCWIDKYVGPVHQFNHLYGYGQMGTHAKNKVSQYTFNPDVCLAYYTTSGYTGSNHPKMCAGENFSGFWYMDSDYALDCASVHGVWTDVAYGGRWHFLQENQSFQITGILNTNTSFYWFARCGEWIINGSVLTDGTFAVTATNPLGHGRPQASCLAYTTLSGGKMYQWDSVGLRWTNALGHSGPFKLERFTTPIWWDFKSPTPLVGP